MSQGNIPFFWENHIQKLPFREQVVKHLYALGESWPTHVDQSFFPMQRFLVSLTDQLRHPDLNEKTAMSKVTETWNRFAAQGLVKGQYDFSRYETLFPLARDRKRKITIYAGPTNSGKTYQAFLELFKTYHDGGSVVYLGPLRLLALEAQERFQNEGISCDLITGEERIMVDPDGKPARARASTVEMLPTNAHYDAVLLDEAQLFSDPQRGWAWTAALVGAATDHLMLTCAPNAVPALEALFKYLGEPVKVIHLERKNPLQIDGVIDRGHIPEGTAFIVFSRREALQWKEEIQNYSGRQVAVLYGALSPEVRKHQAALFRKGEAPYLVATDAIGLGLNLPIKRIVFTTTEKFDGEAMGAVPNDLVRQIAGRAGRVQVDAVKQEPGYVSAINRSDLAYIRDALNEKPSILPSRFQIKANSDQIEGIGQLLRANTLNECLNNWDATKIQSELFFRGSISDIRAAYTLLSPTSQMDLADQYKFCCAPWPAGMLPEGKSTYIINPEWAVRFGKALEKGEPLPWSNFLPSNGSLNEAEDMAKLAGLYQWLSWHWPVSFNEDQRNSSIAEARRCNERITSLLTFDAKKKKGRGWRNNIDL